MRDEGGLGGIVPICPFAAALCGSPLPLFGSTAVVKVVRGGVERLLAMDSMLTVRSWVSPVRARQRRSSIWSSDGVGRVAVGIVGS